MKHAKTLEQMYHLKKKAAQVEKIKQFLIFTKFKTS